MYIGGSGVGIYQGRRKKFSLKGPSHGERGARGYNGGLGQSPQRGPPGAGGGSGVVDDSTSECTDLQLNAEHWFARIEKLYNRNNCLIIINNYSNLQVQIMH